MKKKLTKKTENSPRKGSLVTCAYCRGRGVDRFGILSKLSKCQVCNGKKTNLITEPSEECSACLGGGVFKHHRLPCSVCGGRGQLRRIPGRVRTEASKPGNHKEMLVVESGLPSLNAYHLGFNKKGRKNN